MVLFLILSLIHIMIMFTPMRRAGQIVAPKFHGDAISIMEIGKIIEESLPTIKNIWIELSDSTPTSFGQMGINTEIGSTAII